MILFWVDDCIFFAKDKKMIDEVIDSLNDSFLIEREENVAGFLGLSIERDRKGETLSLTQTDLIDCILEYMSMENSTIKYTQADKHPLGKDEAGAPYMEDWNYRSIVGMMLYLAGSTCPDIAFAVRKCARFSHNPKRIHEVGLKHIARYLKGTRIKGLNMVP